ncbi:MAG: glycosyltransferase family 39 protein [Caldilineales bacterium]
MARSFLRFILMLGGLLLAYAGQYLLDRPDPYSRWLTLVPPSLQRADSAAALLLAGTLLFAVAAPALQPLTTAPRRRFADFTTAAARPLFLLAFAAWALSCLLWLVRGESALVRGLWVLAIAGLLFSQWPRGNLGQVGRWLYRQRRNVWLPAAILLLAALLRLTRLSDLPQDLHGDMASHGLQALDLLAGRTRGIIAYGWASIPMTGFLPTALAMRLSGNQGVVGLALASVAAGLLSVAGLYVLLHELLGRRTALLGAALLAVAYTHIHFSRIAEYMDPVPWAVWSLALLLIGLRRQQSFYFVAAGVLLAACGLMYYAGRVMWIVVPLVLLALLLTDRQRLWQNRRGVVWLALSALITLGPMLLLLWQQPAEWLLRAREVWLFNPAVLEHSFHKYGVHTTAQVVAEQLRRSLLMFNAVADSSTQFGFPRAAADAVSAPLIAAGSLYALLRPRQWRSFLLALMVLVIMLLGSVLTDNPPFWPRLVLILLPALGLAALAVDRFWQAALQAFGQETQRLLTLLAVVGFFYITLLNWTLYTQFAAANGRPRALLGRMVSTLPAQAVLCLVPEDEGGWIHSSDEREIAFFMGQRRSYTVSLDADGRIADYPAPCLQADAVWVVPQQRQAVIAEIRQHLPGSRITQHGPRPGEITFFTVR